MILDRLEFLKAVKFLKHSISDNEEKAKSCLHLRVEDDKCVLTGGGSYTAKKVVLNRPITTEEMSKKGIEDDFGAKSFLIPKGTLLSFETLMDKHKKKCKKLSKNDASYLYIEVDEGNLESFGVEISYKKPRFDFIDFEPLFQVKKKPVDEIGLNSLDTKHVVDGFDKSSVVILTMCGEDKQMHFYQKETEYEAILLPSLLDEKKKEDN